MSKKTFTNEEIEILSKNKYVKRFSAKGITYTDEFKRIFISEDGKGKFPRSIFEECGFDINILGKKRIEMAAYRWRTAYDKEGVLGLQDTRKENSGRPREKELSIEEKYERLKAQISLLKAENELLKKLDMLERRIMRKYGIICPIRKANPYRRIMKATKEHTTMPNLLNRNFKQNIPGKVLLTDITYLFYGNGKKAYLSTIKDGSTNEILIYNRSDKLTLDIATDMIYKLMNEGQVKLTTDAFIHSDQGAHYTSPKFQSLVKGCRLGQSMSRRGNCWDNAPQ